MTDLLIVIDGPAGAGKTTISRELAKRLGYAYVDTGALYRGVACAVSEAGVSPDDDGAVDRICAETSLSFRKTDRGLRLFLNGRDITEAIRRPEISMTASDLSAKPAVRARLLDLQRSLGARKRAVFEGRDMGTVVFPHADLKFFLEADLRVRARRRHGELKNQLSVSFEEILKDMEKRDRNDSSRSIAPLKPADDAVHIDSSRLTVPQVIEKMMDCIRLCT